MAKVCSGIAPLVAAGTPANGNSTAAFVPGSAQQWMCDALAGVVRPDQLSSTVIMVCASLRRTVPKPLPGEPVGGTSFAPSRLVVNSIAALAAGNVINTAADRKTRKD